MHAFTFSLPTQIVFGPGTETETGKLIAGQGGHRVLVVYGGQSAVRSGLIAKVQASLTQAGLEQDTFGGIHPNPRLFQVREGVEKAKAMNADFILAVGGGSVIDASKAIALGVANPEADLWDFWLRNQPVERTLPVGTVLTISAAGSETSDSAVLTRDDTLEKRGLSSQLFRPRFAVMDPELTYTLPPYQIACGVVDMMMHTLDRYFTSVTDNTLTDEIAEGVLRNAVRWGKKAVSTPNDYQAMSELMWTGSISHNDLTGLGAPKDFAPHQLGHELSAKFDCAHGASLSAMWGSWAAYCWKENPSRFAQLGVKCGGWSSTAAVSRTWPSRLSCRQWTTSVRWVCQPVSASWAAPSRPKRSFRTWHAGVPSTEPVPSAPSGYWGMRTSWPSIAWPTTKPLQPLPFLA